jgi:hypothetical protein
MGSHHQISRLITCNNPEEFVKLEVVAAQIKYKVVVNTKVVLQNRFIFTHLNKASLAGYFTVLYCTVDLWGILMAVPVMAYLVAYLTATDLLLTHPNPNLPIRTSQSEPPNPKSLFCFLRPVRSTGLKKQTVAHN